MIMITLLWTLDSKQMTCLLSSAVRSDKWLMIWVPTLQQRRILFHIIKLPLQVRPIMLRRGTLNLLTRYKFTKNAWKLCRSSANRINFDSAFGFRNDMTLNMLGRLFTDPRNINGAHLKLPMRANIITTSLLLLSVFYPSSSHGALWWWWHYNVSSIKQHLGSVRGAVGLQGLLNLWSTKRH